MCFFSVVPSKLFGRFFPFLLPSLFSDSAARQAVLLGGVDATGDTRQGI